MNINIDQNNKSLNDNKQKIKEFLNKQLPFRDKTKPLWKMDIDFVNSDQQVIDQFFGLIGIDRLIEKKSSSYERALRMVLANLMLDFNRSYWIVANRTNTKYLEHSEKWFRTKYVNHIYDCFLHHGLITQIMGCNLTHEATKIVPTVQFQDLIRGLKIKEINIKSPEIKQTDLVVMDRSKKIGLKDQVNLVKGLNEGLNNLTLRYSLDTSSITSNLTHSSHKQTKTRNPPISKEDSSIFVTVENMAYKRVFGDNENEHGRLYAAFQNVPKFVRHNIQFFDQASQEFVKTIELDYGSTHLKMIYDHNKVDCPDTFDFYTVPEYPSIPREFWKQVTMRVINCTSKEDALKSLRMAFNFKELPTHHQITSDTLSSLIDAFTEYHKPISRFLFSGNMRLMNLDSKIAIRILERFVDLDKPILSIHDSFVVMESDKAFLYECMVQAWQEVLETPNEPRIKEVIIETPTMPLEAIEEVSHTNRPTDDSTVIEKPSSVIEKLPKGMDQSKLEQEIERLKLDEHQKKSLEDIWSNF